MIAVGNAADNVIGGTNNGDSLTGGPGKDTINAMAGNDTFNAWDGAVDTINCGTGADIGDADSIDVLHSSCAGKNITIH